MTRVIVKPGICGFNAIIDIDTIDREKLSFKIKSDCKTVTAFGESLSEISKWDIFKPKAESGLFIKLSEHPLHPSCPVPVGIVKAVEVEAGLAIARDISICFEIIGNRKG